ncbi:sigma factor-like helix-turn-helix DNA-binding protein [Marinococcus luteus]|uniref:sigma factor-like helix-turn-helix DNA-binding protein n=1 Tax=Marinococcus luteus TaxID=1122204 RepID=UPI000B857637|nr:sigma factor-like helix-turn-helix DNA-binding protein [Marinococcus luteus]
MPKPQGGGHSDPVYDYVEKQDFRNYQISKMERGVRYIEHRWHRITNDRQAMAFMLRLEAYDYEEIAVVMGVRKSRVHQLIEECAMTLMGGEMYV